jgi:cellobiose phosphorylase
VREFFGLISNTGGGYCFFRDARLRRLTRYRYNNVPMTAEGATFTCVTMADGTFGHPPGSLPAPTWMRIPAGMVWV